MALPELARPGRLKAFFGGIRFRLMAWFSLVLALVLFGFSAFIFTRQVQDLRATAVNRLAVKTRQLESVFRFEGLQSMQDVRVLLPSLVAGGVALIQEDEVLVVSDAASTWTAKLGPVDDATITAMLTTAHQVVHSDEPELHDFSILSSTTQQNQDYQFLITPIRSRSGVTGYMLLGRPVDPDGSLGRLLATLGLASLAIVAGSSGIGYWLAGRVLDPVKTITRTAQQISETDLNRRLNLKTSDELGQLAHTIDGMLARLQAAFERQRQFTADASHELRTPLTIIGLETGRVLENKRSAAEYERTLRIIQGENEHMSRLVNDLLTLSRLESGQTQLQLEEADLSDAALEVVERLAPLAAAKHIHLEAGELPETPLCGDRSSLVQLISNLVQNAIKYAPEGSGRVLVETGRNESEVWVRVEDNGPGIPEEDLPHIFERFYRVDKARRQSGENDPGGSGLGLAIVKWIARAHGGTVNVQSQPGTGSTFTVSLPPRS